jgi:hypothetical protein
MIIANVSDRRAEETLTAPLTTWSISIKAQAGQISVKKRRYIHKMLFMLLHSIKEPFDAQKMA